MYYCQLKSEQGSSCYIFQPVNRYVQMKSSWICILHFVYGFCDSNSRRGEAKYHLRYPFSRKHNRAVFLTIHQRLKETSCSFDNMYKMGQDRCSAFVEEYVIGWIGEDPNVSSRILPRETGISQIKVMNVLHKNLYHPYNFTPVQELHRQDFQKRITFCRWLLEQDIEEYLFLNTILWTDESLFSRVGMFNLRN